MIKILTGIDKKHGRLFILGVGGSAATASHAVNDFRKICGIQAYAPTDNVAELTARTNDDGWESVFVQWLRGCRLSKLDAVLVFSVGGGDLVKNVSANLAYAMLYAKEQKAKLIGVAGRNGGSLDRFADECIIVPTLNDSMVTPYVEAMHGVILHLLVSHPALKVKETKWESVAQSS